MRSFSAFSTPFIARSPACWPSLSGIPILNPRKIISRSNFSSSTQSRFIRAWRTWRSMSATLKACDRKLKCCFWLIFSAALAFMLLCRGLWRSWGSARTDQIGLSWDNYWGTLTLAWWTHVRRFSFFRFFFFFWLLLLFCCFFAFAFFFWVLSGLFLFGIVWGLRAFLRFSGFVFVFVFVFLFFFFGGGAFFWVFVFVSFFFLGLFCFFFRFLTEIFFSRFGSRKSAGLFALVWSSVALGLPDRLCELLGRISSLRRQIPLDDSNATCRSCTFDRNLVQGVWSDSILRHSVERFAFLLQRPDNSGPVLVYSP